MSQLDAATRVLSEQLIVASYKGRAENVVQLINRGARVAVTKYGRTPLHLAAHKGHAEVVRVLLQAGCDLDIEDDGGQTALHRAAVVGNTVIIRAVIHEGCSLDRQDQDGNTALHEASWHGFSRSVRVLVGARANVHAKNKAGNTALHLACQNGHTQTARALLMGGSKPEQKNNIQDTCLHVAVRYNHVNVVKILLGAFCSTAEKNQAGDTALHIAATLNHKKSARLLLDAGADTTIQSNAGQTALDLARDNNSPDVALLLVKASQVQFLRHSRYVKKRRQEQKVEHQAQSAPRSAKVKVFIAPQLESRSGAESIRCCGQVVCKAGECKSELEKNTAERGTRDRKKMVKEKGSISKRGKKPVETVHRRSKLRVSSPETPQPPHGFNAYQLYTLCRGKDGRIIQVPIKKCRCEPLIKKLENQLEATKEQMTVEILSVQEQMDSRLQEIERQNKVQASVIDELKTWCLSKIQEAEERLIRDPQKISMSGLGGFPGPGSKGYTKREASEESSRNQNVAVQLENIPGNAHDSLLENKPQDVAGCAQVVRLKERRYTSIQLDRLLEAQENTGLTCRWDSTGSVDLDEAPSPSTGGNFREYHEGQRWDIGQQTGGVPGAPGDCPSLPPRDWNCARAEVVTRRFFQVVSAQMEQWCESKVEEARKQVEQGARQERAALLERISCLQAELQHLRKTRAAGRAAIQQDKMTAKQSTAKPLEKVVKL